MTMSLRVVVPTADDMRKLGAVLGGACSGGDVLVLAGDLGAGKTTFTQGLARGLGIEDRVTSPTFVIAREHPHPTEGPHLLHVDAYRVGSSLELDDLDLTSQLDRSVVVVEWGRGMAENLSERRIDVEFIRSEEESDETRVVTVTTHGGLMEERLRAGLLDGWTA